MRRKVFNESSFYKMINATFNLLNFQTAVVSITFKT